jgi:gliding motility-associated-like protein
VWTLEDIGCGVSDDTVYVYYFSVKPNITGNKFVCTGEDCTQLSILSLQFFENLQWSAASSNIVFDNPNSASTNVCGLSPGLNTIYVTINGGKCGGNSRDTFEIFYEIFPVAVNDNITVDFGNTVNFQVLNNDVLPADPPDVSIIIPPSNGTLTPTGQNGNYIYRPNSGFSGEDAFVYKICNIQCKEACSSATVRLTVGEAGECYIPTIITPNNDQRNDTFKLPPECYVVGEGELVDIELTIFNQWGDFVFHKNPYRQDTEAWDGTYNGEDLPSGTYYYVIRIEGNDQPKAGFILLQR